jgi:hypothetical protein
MPDASQQSGVILSASEGSANVIVSEAKDLLFFTTFPQADPSSLRSSG